MMIKKLMLPMLAALFLHTSSQAATIAFEFNTPGDVEGWQHNGGANGGTSGTAQATASGGEGVLTSAITDGSGTGDLRVLHNPDLSLPVGTTTWYSIEARFRELDRVTSTPQALSGPDSSLFFGVLDTASGANFATISMNGSGFVEETPADPEFWYTATLDISAAGAFDIGQIRFDPISALTEKNYQIDYVRINAVPEPSSILMLFGLATVAALGRKAVCMK